MIDPNISAKVETSVTIKPARSQTFLVALLGLAALLIICATVLFVIDKPEGWGLIVLAFFAAAGAGMAWRTAQADVDLDNAHPTTLVRADGTSLSTDLRALRNPQALEKLSQLVTVILNRKPLPVADGLVNDGLIPLPDSKEQAESVTHQLNTATQAVTDVFLDALKSTDKLNAIAPVLLDAGNDKA